MSADPLQPDPGQRLEELLAEHREPPYEPEAEPQPFDPFAPLAPPDADDAGETREPDESSDPLPDAPLFALLRSIEQEILVERIDRLWVFPPRRLELGETSLVVVAAYPEADADRRRVFAAHYTVSKEAKEPALALAEYGTAPTDRVGRLVEEVVQRIKEGPAGAPQSHRIDGDAGRWNTVLHSLAEAHLEEVQKDRRIR